MAGDGLAAKPLSLGVTKISKCGAGHLPAYISKRLVINKRVMNKKQQSKNIITAPE